MTTYTDTNPLHVVIAGGGVAALETMMALRSLAADHVRITLLAPERDYHYRPMAVAEPFSIAHARSVALVAIAADFDARHVRGTLAAVEPDAHRVVTGDGERIAYDALVIACGTRTRPAFDGAITVDDRSIGVALRGLIQDIEEGYTHKVAFVAHTQAFWPLPLYELALQTANRAYDMNATVDIAIVSPEIAPLALLGDGISGDVALLLRDAAITSTARRAPRSRGAHSRCVPAIASCATTASSRCRRSKVRRSAASRPIRTGSSRSRPTARSVAWMASTPPAT